MRHRLLFVLFLLACFGLGCTLASACPVTYSAYSAYQSYAPVYAQKQVYQQQYIAPIALLLPVPTYSAGYALAAPTAPAAAPVDLDARLKALTEQVERLGRQPAYQPQQQPQQPQAPKQTMPPADPSYGQPGAQALPINPFEKHPNLSVQKCAHCHEASYAARAGGGVTLFQGENPVKLSEEEAQVVTQSVLLGKMPKCKGCAALSTKQKIEVLAAWSR